MIDESRFDLWWSERPTSTKCKTGPQHSCKCPGRRRNVSSIGIWQHASKVQLVNGNIRMAAKCEYVRSQGGGHMMYEKEK